MSEPQPIPPGGDVPAPEPVVINLLPLPVLIFLRTGTAEKPARFDPNPELGVCSEPTHDPMVWGPFLVLGPVGEARVVPPPPIEGTIYIVCESTRHLYPERRDLFSLYKPTITTDEGEDCYAVAGLVGWPACVLRRVTMVGPKFESSR